MEPTFLLQIFVDKQSHVVFAEAPGDFVDVLLSFLTLPLATVIRLVSKKQSTKIGYCINNLYRSVENFDAEDFWNHICKQMLLRPRNPCDALCQKLKLNVEYDKEHTKYFMCGSCGRSNDSVRMISTFAKSSCTCGRLMDIEMKLVDSAEEVKVNGAFVEGKAMYLIFDDLKVMKASPDNVVQQLSQLGFKDMSNLRAISRSVSLSEILDLLKQALISKSPLTDVFLGLVNVGPKRVKSFCPKLEAESRARNCKMNLKLTVSKSKNKVLYAEAEGDFIDFLLSFLTIPLGTILKLLNGNPSLGCIYNLYKSVKGLNPSWCHASCTALLDPGVASQFACQSQPLNIVEQETPTYWIGIKINDSSSVAISKRSELLKYRAKLKNFEPRSADGRKAIGFVKRPTMFAVFDDLTVTPLTSNSSFQFLHKMDISLDDLEKHVVSIGKTEALNLLRASLTSKAALTEGLWKKPKPKEESGNGQSIVISALHYVYSLVVSK